MNESLGESDRETAREPGTTPTGGAGRTDPRAGGYPWKRKLGFVALALLVLLGITQYVRYAAKYRFDSAIWKATGGDDPARVFMVDDLLRRHPLIGMPRADVEDLLGRPPATDYFRDFEYVYWLGPERGFIAIDSEWLGLKFEQDRVTEARVLSD